MDTPDAPRTLEYRDIDELRPALTNPKDHDLAELSRAIDRFGFTSPAEMDGRTERLVVGHGRLERLLADREAGKAAPEGIVVTDDGRWLMPVVCGWRSKSDAEARAYVITNNRLGELGGWKQDQLYDDLASVKTATGDLGGVGFTDRELEALRIQVKGHDRKPHADPDDAPVPATVTVTRPGDVWQLGPHRLCCGDATKPEDVTRLFAGVTPDMVLTDPPYCSGGFQEAGKRQGSVGTRGDEMVANDTLSTRGYMALLKSMLSLAQIGRAHV